MTLFKKLSVAGVALSLFFALTLSTSAATPCDPLLVNDENTGPPLVITNQSCATVTIDPGTISLEFSPTSILFPQKFPTFIPQSSFSNDNPATGPVDVSTGSEDIVTVKDLRNSGGFEVTITASPFTSGDFKISLNHFYVVTTYPDEDDLTPLDPTLEGSESGGVEYANGFAGASDITSSVFTTGNMNQAQTYIFGGSNFDFNPPPSGGNPDGGDGIPDPVTIMSTSTDHLVRASQAVSLYIEIPADQEEATYTTLLTIDLII